MLYAWKIGKIFIFTRVYHPCVAYTVEPHNKIQDYPTRDTKLSHLAAMARSMQTKFASSSTRKHIELKTTLMLVFSERCDYTFFDVKSVKPMFKKIFFSNSSGPGTHICFIEHIEMYLQMSFAKCQPLCFGPNVSSNQLRNQDTTCAKLSCSGDTSLSPKMSLDAPGHPIKRPEVHRIGNEKGQAVKLAGSEKTLLQSARDPFQ